MSLVKRVTINDVALAAGVSVSTVSLVLSGKGRISSATGERVNAAVEKLGFVRNQQAVALRGGHSGRIGVIVHNLCHPFYAELTAGLAEELEQNGRMLMLLQEGNGGERLQRCVDTLLAQGVDGIIIAGVSGRGVALRERAAQSGVTLLFASRDSHPDEVAVVRPDNQQAARLATEYLINKGHQRIAWLGGHSASLARAERLGGFCATLLQYGLPFHSHWIIECESTQRRAAEAVVSLLRRNPTITAVVCHNSTVAMGAWFGLLRAGRQSGEDSLDSYYDSRIALAAFADVPEMMLDDVPVTWVTTPAREIGRSVAQRILRAEPTEQDTANSFIVPARLVAHKG
ncbi:MULTISPECIES: Mal regulon transcriptional regulator MalI [Tenebrionibacter/Tenebrionicola group]|jgi:LacI family transcriptional regulator of maltose regulon|uniref:Mal regulon transcriptional regulator MalI n=2 Tax=Tenebrionibacter/Tenebrionicola group TaxID=2969848 RepID=A0A8K0V7Q5_9ENTR|nr:MULTISPECIES: Mal regulon transcriptional regulator MalI [Tenebrionibacter/Tenebrionicola group]MBK4716474.1 Mal regulon transcriptional regulator MalI [Tenebrionibacter intestinalis]MBV5096808.1 Mal regulon transcriptional regulator MalI [Tenebrionicola larvae]